MSSGSRSRSKAGNLLWPFTRSTGCCCHVNSGCLARNKQISIDKRAIDEYDDEKQDTHIQRKAVCLEACKPTNYLIASQPVYLVNLSVSGQIQSRFVLQIDPLLMLERLRLLLLSSSSPPPLLLLLL